MYLHEGLKEAKEDFPQPSGAISRHGKRLGFYSNRELPFRTPDS